MEELIGAAEVVDEPVADRIVLAGFEPFDGRQRNRSWDLVRRFRGEPETDVFQLPVDFSQLPDVVSGILSRRPRVLLMVGEAATSELLVEQVALNIADTDRPDNAGRMPQAEKVVSGGPMALLTSWDARRLAGRLHQEGIPASVSFHAGTFACNAALYLALKRAKESRASEGPQIGESRGAIGGAVAGELPIGFFHIPNSRGPSGLGGANLSRALELGIEELSRLN
jgi:pyroglutamyl-peptidase